MKDYRKALEKRIEQMRGELGGTILSGMRKSAGLLGEDEKKKNSVMTFYRIRDKNVEKLKKKSEILYSKE